MQDLSWYDIEAIADKNGKAVFYWCSGKYALTRAFGTKDDDTGRFYITKEGVTGTSEYLCNVDSWNSVQMEVYTYLFLNKASAYISIEDVMLADQNIKSNLTEAVHVN